MDNIPRRNQSGAIELTHEENETMKKCVTTSIWTHSLPAMIVSSAFIRYLQHYKGVTLRFWANTGLIIGAGIVGRISALPGCLQEVVSKYPEGSLAKTIEEMKNKRQGLLQSDREVYEQPDDKSGIFEPYARPAPQAGPSTQSSGQTYDDLRRRNRDQYIDSRRTNRTSPATPSPQDQPPSSSMYSPASEPSSSLYSSLPEPSGSLYYDPPSPYMDSSPGVSPQEESKIRKRKRVNQYGDEIED